MTDAAGRVVSQGHMVVSYVDKQTNPSADWPADVMAFVLRTQIAMETTPKAAGTSRTFAG